MEKRVLFLPIQEVKEMLKPCIEDNTMVLRESSLYDYENSVVYKGTYYMVPIATIFALFPKINIVTYKVEDEWEGGKEEWKTFYREEFSILPKISDKVLLKAGGSPPKY
jgi:hypothetical protein